MGGEDPLEEGMATHSKILAWRIPWTEEPGGLQSIYRVTKNLTWQKWLTTHTHMCAIVPAIWSLFLQLKPLESWIFSLLQASEGRVLLHPLLEPCCPHSAPPPIFSMTPWCSPIPPLRMRWPKYWSFSFSIIPSKEIPGLILQSKGLSRVFSNTTVQKHQFFSTQPSSQSNSHIHTWPEEKP